MKLLFTAILVIYSFGIFGYSLAQPSEPEPGQNTFAFEIFECCQLLEGEPEVGSARIFENYTKSGSGTITVDPTKIEPNGFAPATALSLTLSTAQLTYEYDIAEDIVDSDDGAIGIRFDEMGRPWYFETITQSSTSITDNSKEYVFNSPFVTFENTSTEPFLIADERIFVNGVGINNVVSRSALEMSPEPVNATWLSGGIRFRGQGGEIDDDGKTINRDGFNFRGAATFGVRFRNAPIVRISQAPLPSVVLSDQIKFLVKDRRTAIIIELPNIDYGATESVRVDISGSGSETFSFRNFLNVSSKRHVLYFTPKTEGALLLSIDVDPVALIFSSPQVELQREYEVEPLKSIDLVFGKICRENSRCDRRPTGSVCSIEPNPSRISGANVYVQSVFPLADNALPLSADGTARQLFEKRKTWTPASCPTGKNGILIDDSSVPNSYLDQSVEIDAHFFSTHVKKFKRSRLRDGKVPADFQRAAVYVYDGYFRERSIGPVKLGDETSGVRHTKFGKSFFVSDSAPAKTVAHELGHTFGLSDEYTIDDDGKIGILGISANGEDVYRNVHPTGRVPDDAIGFMGATVSSLKAWVTTGSWLSLAEFFKGSSDDPLMLTLNFLVDEAGNVRATPWAEVPGFPGNFGSSGGSWSVNLFDQSGQSIASYDFSPSYTWGVEGIGDVQGSLASVVTEIEFPLEAARITIENNFDLVVYDVDPVQKVLDDTLMSVLNGCELDFSTSSSIEALQKDLLVASRDDDGQTWRRLLSDDAENLLASIDEEQCDFTPELVFNLQDVRDSIASAIERVSTRYDLINVLVGDLDIDGDVDRDDLNILMALRNQPADGPDDPKDLDGDGQITGLDARKLTQLCTRPRCAVE